MLVSSLDCSIKSCEADAEGSVSKCCNVMGRACSVFELCLCLRSASGRAGENFCKTLLTLVFSHCLTLSLVTKITVISLFISVYFRSSFDNKPSSLHLVFVVTCC